MNIYLRDLLHLDILTFYQNNLSTICIVVNTVHCKETSFVLYLTN